MSRTIIVRKTDKEWWEMKKKKSVEIEGKKRGKIAK